MFVCKNASLLNNGLGQSYCIMVPEGYGLGIWRRMVYSGCKAIAEREHLKLMMECGRRVFPYDFPNTVAGQKQSLDQAVSYLENDYCLKPSSKRVNF